MEWYGKNGRLKENTMKMLEYINKCQQISSTNIKYGFFTDSIRELSGAAFVALNLVSEEDKNKSTVKAVSGAPEILSLLMKTFGFKLEGTEWEATDEERKISKKNKLIYFSSFNEIGYFNSVPYLASGLKTIEKILLPDGLYAVEFNYQGEFLGIITLIMPRGKVLENKELIEVYISQIASTIKRLRAENKLQQKVNALQESEAKFKAYMENAPVGIFVADFEGHYLEVNRAACQMSGYTEEELLNISIPEFIAPEFLEAGIKSFEKLIAEGYVEDEIMVRKKNGDIFWISLASVVIGEQKVIAFCQDITERKEKEERAKELNFLHSFSRLLQKEKNDLEKILQETVTLLPPSFQDPEAASACITFKGTDFKTQNHEPSPWKISANLEASGEHTGTIEVCYHKPPFPEREPFTKEEKLLLKTVAELLSRVTEQILARENLQESNSKLATTLHSIGDGVITTDTNGKITRLNPQAEKLTGWAEEEALGRALHEVFHIVNAKTGEPVANPVYRVIHTVRTQGLANDTILVARDGTERQIADSAAPIRGDEEKMLGVVMVFSDVTERKNAEESLKDQLRFETMLASISNIFASQPSEQLEQSIKFALEQVGEFFQVDRSYIFNFSNEGKQISNSYEWCAQGIEAQIHRIQNLSVDKFPWWLEKIRKNKHVYIQEVDKLPPQAEAEKKEFKTQGIGSLLTIPMMKNGIVFGFLGLDKVKEKKIWTENHVRLLRIVADLISNAYLRNLSDEKVRYESVHDGLTGLYNRIFLEREMERLDTERQLPIAMVMADLNDLKLINDTFGHKAGDEMLKQTAETLSNSFRGEEIIARWGGDEFVIFLPQTTEENAKTIGQRIEEKCKETYIKGLPLSLALGIAIKKDKNKDLEEVLKEAEENMYKHKLAEGDRVKGFMLNTLLKNLEGKSFETETHYSGMQSIAQKIGREIGLSKSELNHLEMLITLHDIGEINISGEILTKKDPLTAEEWEIIKKHPETGYRIARAKKEFARVAQGILSHHERWDGSGYPQGLKGKDIPLLARITAIADAYEVMSSGRPYKKVMSKREVVAELERCAGAQFDPELVEIALVLLEKKIKENG